MSKHRRVCLNSYISLLSIVHISASQSNDNTKTAAATTNDQIPLLLPLPPDVCAFNNFSSSAVTLTLLECVLFVSYCHHRLSLGREHHDVAREEKLFLMFSICYYAASRMSLSPRLNAVQRSDDTMMRWGGILIAKRGKKVLRMRIQLKILPESKEEKNISSGRESKS